MIVVVEDDSSILKMMEIALQDMALVGTSNVTDAIKTIDKVVPEVVILDYFLGNETGGLVVEHVRRHHPKTLIMLMTAGNLSQISGLVNPNESLSKPFSLEELREKLFRMFASLR